MKFADVHVPKRVVSYFRYLLAVVLILCEFYFFLKMGAELLALKGVSELLSGPRSLMIMELLTRSGWALILALFVRWSQGRGRTRERRILLFTTLTAVTLAFLSCFSMISFLFGLHYGVSVLAWLKAMEITLLLIWALSLLLFLISPFFRFEIFTKGTTSRLLVPAITGAFVYFILKGLSWLGLMSLGIPLPVHRLRLLWLFLPLLVFVGRVAFILLLISFPENGDKAEGR